MRIKNHIMKRIILSIALLASVVVTNAQNFVFTTSQHIDTVTLSGALVLDIYFETDTAEDITYKWEKVSNTFPAAWDLGLCDYTNCHIGIPNGGTMTPLTVADVNNGLGGFFKMNCNDMGTQGDGIIKLYVYEENNFSRGDTVSWYVTYGALSINDGVEVAFEVAPNPASDIINITANGNYNATVYNQIGEQVYAFKSTEVTSISSANWAKGLYFITMQNESGALSTRKVIIQ
ncbi:MAG: hypothetical protein ACI9N1_001179 [Flavobacteriales bacterium]|jgi:hypothetical protein